MNLNGDYLSKGSGIDNGGAGMTIYVNVPVRHEHKYGAWQIASTGNVHFRKCSCGVQEEKPHEWKYLEGQDKYKCTVCGYEIDGEKDRITYVYASPRSPIAGEHPGDYTPAEWVEIGGANYKVESIVWKNMDDTDVTTFESGKIYKGTVTFKADTGFAFDGDRIYASKIFNTSNAEVVGKYTLTDEGSTLTATFKLKNENVVKPGLKAKVKLPTLNDKIGQSLPAVELVDTTLPENVALTYNVYENDISTEVTDPDYKVKPNQKYFYLVWLKLGDSTDITEITKTYNVSYEVTDGGDAETCTDFVGYGVLAMYQTPDTSKINSVALTVTAPKYGEAPATTATGANDTLYTVGTPTWTPAETDGKFGANTYTVSIPVTAASGYSFDENGIYTINGYVATYADGKVSYTFPQLSHSVYVGMTYTVGNFIYQITSIDTATLGQSKVIGVVAAKKNKITKVTIPDRADCKGYGLNVTAVGDKAFKSMKKLKKVTIGNKVTVIGKNVFNKCSKLKTVVIGKAVKTISSKAFIGDNKIKKITFKGDKLKTVKKNAFSKKAKKNIKSKKTKLKGNKKAIKLFKKKLKIK